MNEDEVPQDELPTYAGHRKLFYAVDREGRYVTVPSSGWEAEGIATGSALEEIDRLRNDAWRRARMGVTSPLEYYMHSRRMDLALLSQATGFSRWRVKRHFRPVTYARLSDRIIERYAEALGIGAATLRTLVEKP